MPTIYHDLTIKALPGKVFDGISLPEHLINWWPLTCSGKPEKGAVYSFYFGPDYDWLGEVTACKEGVAFHVKMIRAMTDWEPTTFGFDLNPGKEGTELSFWHKDWKAYNQHFKISSFCWAILLNGLKNYLEKGTIVPFEERN